MDCLLWENLLFDLFAEMLLRLVFWKTAWQSEAFWAAGRCLLPQKLSASDMCSWILTSHSADGLGSGADQAPGPTSGVTKGELVPSP